MTSWTSETLARPEVSPNPITVFGILGAVGDTFGVYRIVAREVTGPDANPSAFLRVTFSGHGSEWTSDYPNPFGADLVAAQEEEEAPYFVLDGVDWSDEAEAYVTAFPALAYGPDYSYGATPIVSRRVAEAFVAHMTFARVVLGDVDLWQWDADTIRVTPWEANGDGSDVTWITPDDLGRFDLGAVGYTFARVDSDARILRPVPRDPAPVAPAAVCSQCDGENGDPADGAYGMCPTCLHDARRSGWEPGK